MRSGPSAGDLGTSRFRHDIRAKGRLLEHATGKREAYCSTHKDSPIHGSARLVKLPNEPVELRRDSQEDFADDMNHLALLSINGASTAGTCSEEKLAVFRGKHEAHRDSLFWRGYR